MCGKICTYDRLITEVGDLILEVNGMVLHNRHHLNASAMIKNLPDSDVTFVLMRKGTGTHEVAVKPLTQFPPEPFKDNPIDRYSGKQYIIRLFILSFRVKWYLTSN